MKSVGVGSGEVCGQRKAITSRNRSQTILVLKVEEPFLAEIGPQ